MRDGCFFAAFLLASDDSGTYLGTEDELTSDIEICLRALRAMRWGFSKSEEREHTVWMVWEATRRKRLERASVLLQNAQNPMHMGLTQPEAALQRGQRPFLTPLTMSDPSAGMSLRHGRPMARDEAVGQWSAAPLSLSAAPISPSHTSTSHRSSPSLPTASSFAGRQTLPPIAPSRPSAHDRSPPSGPSSHTSSTGFNDALPPIQHQPSSYYYHSQPYGYTASSHMDSASQLPAPEPPRQIQLEPAPSSAPGLRQDIPGSSSSTLYPTWSSYSPPFPSDPALYHSPEYDEQSVVSLRF
jgi:hypothetical protein